LYPQPIAGSDESLYTPLRKMYFFSSLTVVNCKTEYETQNLIVFLVINATSASELHTLRK